MITIKVHSPTYKWKIGDIIEYKRVKMIVSEVVFNAVAKEMVYTYKLTEYITI